MNRQTDRQRDRVYRETDRVESERSIITVERVQHDSALPATTQLRHNDVTMTDSPVHSAVLSIHTRHAHWRTLSSPGLLADLSAELLVSYGRVLTYVLGWISSSQT